MLAPSLAAQTGFGTRQDHLEEVYGHELTTANLEEIDSWRLRDVDWWIDEERNLASWAKLRRVQQFANNSAELLVDPRAHEELFGVKLQPSSDPTGLGTLVFDAKLRPDLYTITDLISRELDPLFDHQLSYHTESLAFREEVWEMMKGLDIEKAFPWLVTLEQTQRLVTSSIEGDAALFVRTALMHLYSEALRSSSEVALETLEQDFAIEDRLRAFTGADIREEYVRVFGDRELSKFQAAFARADSFLKALDPAHRSLFLRYVVGIKAKHMLTGAPLVDPATNHAFFDSLDLELRGANRSYARVLPTDVTQIANAYSVMWVLEEQRTYDPEILDNVEWMHNYDGECEVFLEGEIGIKTPNGSGEVEFHIEVGSVSEYYLRALVAEVSWNPTLVHESGTRSPTRSETLTCLFGESRLSPGGGLRCAVPVRAPASWKNIQVGGTYFIEPAVNAEIRLGLPESFNDLPWATDSNITATSLILTAGIKYTFPGEARVWTIRSASMRKSLSWDRKSRTVTLNTCCPDDEGEGGGGGTATGAASCGACQEPLVRDSETGACVCGEDLFGPYAEAPICRSFCELQPESCERPPRGRRNVADDEDEDEEDYEEDEMPVVEEPGTGGGCSRTNTMVCSEYYDERIETVVVECDVARPCSPAPGKTIDCSQPQWWLYCDGWELVDEMPADLLEAAACAPGEQRCRSADETQTCQASLWSWRERESCPSGCDPTTDTCHGSSAQCSGFETRCVNGGTSVQMCDGGVWGPSTACTNGCDAQTQQCSIVGPSVCLDGATRCINGGAAQQTCENGQWGSAFTCPGGCNTSTQQCTVGGPECTEGQRRCVNGDNSVQFCEGGAWGAQQFCPYGCDSLTLQCNASNSACSGTYQNKCTTYGARTCSSAGDSLVCEPAEPNGCLTWQIAETCGSGCSAGTCNSTVCSGSDICGFEGARRCSSASFEQVCSTAGDGCLRWEAPLGGGSCDTTAGEVCSNGLCQQVSCLFNSDCAASSRFCDGGSCAPCTSSSQCSPGYSCHSNGRCQPAF